MHLILRSVKDVTVGELRDATAYVTRAFVRRHDKELVKQLNGKYFNGRLGCWGVSSGPHGSFAKLWRHIGDGDLVLFSGANRVFAEARVVARGYSRALAARVWPDEPDAPYLFFTRGIRPLTITYPALAKAFGRKPGFIPQRFDVLGAYASEQALTRLFLRTGAT